MTEMVFLRSVSLCLLLCAASAACNRTEPEGPTSAGEVRMLVPIAEYYLGTHVAEPSGIAYWAKNNSLLVVSDSNPDLYEIDLRGALLRTIPTVSEDLEGVALSGSNDTICIVEEKNRKVVLYSTSGALLSSFSADVATLPNNALEGVTVGRNGHLLVLNEKAPGMILEYTPAGTETGRWTLPFASDYSDLFYDAGDDCLWVISDESAKIMKIDLNGSLVAQWPIPFTKGEGITIVRDTVYVVNDSDKKMYVFLRPT